MVFKVMMMEMISGTALMPTSSRTSFVLIDLSSMGHAPLLEYSSLHVG